MISMYKLFERLSGYDTSEFKPYIPRSTLARPMTKMVKHQQAVNKANLRKPINSQLFKQTINPTELKKRATHANGNNQPTDM